MLRKVGQFRRSRYKFMWFKFCYTYDSLPRPFTFHVFFNSRIFRSFNALSLVNCFVRMPFGFVVDSFYLIYSVFCFDVLYFNFRRNPNLQSFQMLQPLFIAFFKRIQSHFGEFHSHLLKVNCDSISVFCWLPPIQWEMLTTNRSVIFLNTHPLACWNVCQIILHRRRHIHPPALTYLVYNIYNGIKFVKSTVIHCELIKFIVVFFLTSVLFLLLSVQSHVFVSVRCTTWEFDFN